MAGSYSAAVTGKGKLRSPESMRTMATENQGDAYETIEEMYGMIWYLAAAIEASGEHPGLTRADIVESARRNWGLGIDRSPGRAK